MAKSSLPARSRSGVPSTDRTNPLATVVFALVGVAVAWWFVTKIFGWVLFWLKLGVVIAVVGGIWYGVKKLGNKN